MSEPLDPLAVLEALGVRDAATVTPVRGGFDTAIWRVEPAAHRRDRGGVPHAEGLKHGQRIEWLRHADYPCADY